MGFGIKFNWAMQIEPPMGLDENSIFEFEKQGNRVYPLSIPIDLIDLERNAIAKIKIIEFTIVIQICMLCSLFIYSSNKILINEWIKIVQLAV